MDVWNLPGGALESGELPSEAVVRETQEETGLVVEIEKLVGVYGKEGKDDIVFAFACRIASGDFSPTEEADDCTYFNLDELPVNTIPRQVERIRDAATSPAEPLFRRQSGPSTADLLRAIVPAGPGRLSSPSDE